LNTKGGEKNMKHKKRLNIKVLSVLIALTMAISLTFGLGVPAMASTNAEVTITATPEYLAMTNSEDNWTLGMVAASTTYWWTPTGVAPAGAIDDAECNSTLTNTGTVTSDIKIHGHNFAAAAGAWALDVNGSPAADNVTIKYGWSGLGDVGSMQFLTLSDTFVTTLAPSSANTSKWLMSLETGTFTAGDDETGIVTLTVFKHV
jgi:hypothetical protein